MDNIVDHISDYYIPIYILIDSLLYILIRS